MWEGGFVLCPLILAKDGYLQLVASFVHVNRMVVEEG